MVPQIGRRAALTGRCRRNFGCYVWAAKAQVLGRKMHQAIQTIHAAMSSRTVYSAAFLVFPRVVILPPAPHSSGSAGSASDVSRETNRAPRASPEQSIMCQMLLGSGRNRPS